MAQQNPFRTLNEALRWAVVAGELDSARSSLVKGASADCDIEGQSLLCHIITQTNLMTVVNKDAFIALLLEFGADINRAGPDGVTPLIAALQTEDQPTLKRILAAGANANMTPDGKASPLYLAVEGDLADTSEWRTHALIAAGANPDLPVQALVNEGAPSVRALLEKTASGEEQLTATGITTRSDLAAQAQQLLGCLGLAADIRERHARTAVLVEKSNASAGRYKLGRGPRT